MSAAVTVSPADFAAPATVATMRTRALIAGIVGLAAAAYFALDPNYREPFLRSWLVAFMFWLGMTLGPLALLMLQYVTGGNWGRIGRRFWEAATRCLPLTFLFWLPIALGMKLIYPWASWSREQAIHELGFKGSWYLRPEGFWWKGIIFFGLWFLLGWYLRRWSKQEEEGRTDGVKFITVQHVSGVGIMVYALTVTFAATDWVSSLNPYWFSSVWGMLFIVGQVLTTFAFTIWLLARLAPIAPVSRVINPERLHDFGKLMFAFVVLWAYLSFSQWIIIWSGNLTEEIKWYLDRIHGRWQVVAVSLMLLHFAFPFFIMLSRNLKRNIGRLVWIATLILVMRYVDLFWLVQPKFHISGEVEPLNSMSILMTLASALAMGGLWLALFFWNLGRRSLMPVNDPNFPKMLELKQHG
ncbi:MAG TPA: hypothetical protein VNW97_14745 [Candidatus Saccharimonadales bacterium]|jgi:hypothetical protein|nr:hypothetical protein [Candidatus Saccharimonadales bacterium]